MSRASTSVQQAEELRTAEQGQQALEFAPLIGGGGEFEGKSTSIKQISDSIQSTKACCFSSSIRLRSAAGIGRQLAVAPNWRARLRSSVKKERKRDSDEPDAEFMQAEMTQPRKFMGQ